MTGIRRPTRGSADRATLLGPVVAVLVADALTLAGIPGWVAIIVTAAAAAVLLRRMLPLALALGVTLGGGVVLVLGVLLALDVTKLPLVPTLLATTTAAVAAIAVAVRRRPVPPRTPGAVVLLAASAAGPIGWVVSAIAAAVLRPGPSGWSGSGDALNNLMYLRMLLADGGVAIGAATNPMPLAASVLALVAAPGRTGDAGELLLHDLAAFPPAWALGLVATTAALGLVAGLPLRRAGVPTPIVAATTAVVSLAATGWIFTGYATEYGFLSIPFAIALLAVAVLVALSGRERPVLASGVLALLTLGLLATWAPLAALPVAMAVALIFARRRAAFPAPRADLLFALVAVAACAAYGLGVVAPVLVRERAALAAAGGIVALPFGVLGAVLAAALAGAIWWTVRRRRSVVGPVSLAVVAGSAAALGVLLVASRSESNPWTYYPLKLAWIVIVLDGALALGLLVGALAARRGTLVPGLIGMLVVAVAATLWTPPVETNGFVHRHGLAVPHADAENTEILGEVASRLAPPVIPWRVDPDTWVDEWTVVWLTQLWEGTLAPPGDLRIAGLMAFTDDSPEMLCRILELAPDGTAVETTDPDLGGQLRAGCPAAAQVTVTLRGGPNDD